MAKEIKAVKKFRSYNARADAKSASFNPEL